MGVTKIVKTVPQTQKSNLPTLDTTTFFTPTPTPQSSPNPTSIPIYQPNTNKRIITIDGQQEEHQKKELNTPSKSQQTSEIED